MQGPSIVVGIDFGTTFSGVAWALEGSIDDIEVLTSWPGTGNRTSVKVPSSITYNGKDIQWGYQIGPLTEACRGIKLLLDEEQETGYSYAPSRASEALLAKHGKNAVEVAGDYISQLIKQVAKLIQRRLGITSDDCSMKFVLTVPAVWSDRAKDATLRAAIAAGVPAQGISLVSEPEAAALYSLRALQLHAITREDVFIVCDAGGGTVDLISYVVKDLDPLRLVEATKGTGRICGSMLLDHGFEDLLREKMGYENYATLPNKSKEAALLYWRDRIKPLFAGKFDEDFDDVPYYIPIPGAKDDPDVPVEDGFFELTSGEIEAIFDPIVRGVLELIGEQVASLSKAEYTCGSILLVGGFGASEYLFRRVQDAQPSIRILQPPNSWSAVVRGAVQHGLDGNRVESRVARRNYGVPVRMQWSSRSHAEEDKVWDALEEKYFNRNTEMRWYINKHSKIVESKPVRMDFYRAVTVEETPNLTFWIKLYVCNADIPPGIFTQSKVCQLKADLDNIPRDLFKKRSNSKGVEYWEVWYTLVMTPTSASLLFELEFNGVSYGSVMAKY
ncbi:actin-like ATPase domain-containing protein [Aspergillus carlsbadensis]|nr:actin-like ATPase domain-containing protein [Aspergillus carlsbadensis]